MPLHMATKDHSFESDCKKIHEYYSRGKINHLALYLAHKNHTELKQIKDTYMRMYNEDLAATLLDQNSNYHDHVAVSPHLCSALATWMLGPLERFAVMVKEALDGKHRGVNYKALVEVFVGVKSSHMAMINQIYYDKFRRYLDQDIACIEPTHPYQKILIALGASHKAHHEYVSHHIAKSDAMRLCQTREGSHGPINEAVVLEIFSKRSVPQLKLTFSSYKCIYGYNYTKSLKNENIGEFEDALRVVVKCIYKPPKYYAKASYGCLKAKVSDKGDVARILMTRAEIDIDEIKRIFKKKYEMELREAISESIRIGDYRDFLVALATKSANFASHLSL